MHEPNPEHDAPLDVAAFRDPGAEQRIAPFWFWNGAMDEVTVRHQVRQMAQGGCGGFFIHARQGLTLPYLSDEWFARVCVAVEEAKQCGLQVWLYDEYPYPSGIAGGLLTANRPELRARALEQHDFEAKGGEPLRHELPRGRLVCALACPVKDGRIVWERGVDVRRHCGVVLTRELFWLWPMGHIPYNEKRYMADEGRLVLSWTPPATDAEWRIFTGVETQFRGFKYYDCFFDPLATGAADEFLRLTHERYAEHLGEHFGDTIPGIFTDETEPPAWSPVVEDELRAGGFDLSQLLPALRRDDHPQSAHLRYTFRQTALRLFHERWEQPIARWCAEHKLIWAAEKPTWRASQFWDVAQPSTDAGHRRVGMPPEPLPAQLRANHRVAMAAAEQLGTEVVRCECFHSLGWGATLQDQKWAIDWLCAQGVNRFTPHAFYATSSGLTKHDAAPSFFLETPAWPHFRLLGDYAARLGLAMSTGRERARLALLIPTASEWIGGPLARQSREEFERLMNALMAEHHPFHPVDALALTRATPRDGGLELGRTRYEVLIVPPLGAVDTETEAAIRAALDAGLPILMADPLPGAKHLADGSPIELLAQLPGVTRVAPDAWPDVWNQHRALSVADEAGHELEAVWALWREAGKQQLLFLANTSGENVSAQVRIDAQCAWRNWSLESGETAPHPSQVAGERSHFSVHLPPYGSILLVGAPNSGATPDSVAARPTQPVILPTEGKWKLSLDRPNALRLDRWRIACDGEDWSSPEREDADLNEVEALPLCYLDQTRKTWVRACERQAGETVWYRRHVEAEFVPGDLALLVENGAMEGDWRVWINGVEVGRDAFEATEYNGGDKVSARVASHFRRGDNVIALCVAQAPETGGLRTPLHLTGSFGLVGTKRRVLGPLPELAAFEDLVGAGLPHFSGAATYGRTFDAAQFEGADSVALPDGFVDAAELWLNGRSLGVRAWSPYQWQLPPLQTAVELQITVTNTLLPFYEGQIWDAGAQRGRAV